MTLHNLESSKELYRKPFAHNSSSFLVVSLINKRHLTLKLYQIVNVKLYFTLTHTFIISLKLERRLLITIDEHYVKLAYKLCSSNFESFVTALHDFIVNHVCALY